MRITSSPADPEMHGCITEILQVQHCHVLGITSQAGVLDDSF